MTLEDFYDLVGKNRWKFETDTDGRQWVVNPANNQRIGWNEKIYHDLVEIHDQSAGDDALDMIVKYLS